MAQAKKKRVPVIEWAKGQIHVPDSFFEPLPEDMLRAFEGEGTDCYGLSLGSEREIERAAEPDADRARRLEDFNLELKRRMAAIERGETVDPMVVRAKLQRKSQERRNRSESR